MNSFNLFLPKIIEHKIVSIVGIHKNVGKTTTLNKILQLSREKYRIALTSIGIDGEVEDILGKHKKPRIYVKKGTIVATASQCLEECDVTKEILESTNFITPFGKIIIFRAISDGYVLLAGPSITNEIKELCKHLEMFDVDLILIDGAFSRRSLASPSITHATILAVGAAFSIDMNETVRESIFISEIFQLPSINDVNIRNLFEEVKKVGYILSNNTVHSFDLDITIDSDDYLINASYKKPKFFIIKGLINNNLLKNLILNIPNLSEIPILIQDATKILISRQIYDLFKKAGGKFKVFNPIRLIAITINPWSPEGFDYPKNEFLFQLQKALTLPIFNIHEE